jgi:hypothetical protein
MQAAGCEPWFPLETLSVRGIVEVLSRLPEILALRRALVKRLLAARVDLFIGVDAPDFNLGVEAKLKRAGVRTMHFVSPSIWAWRRERVHKIRRAVDRILTLFPFELPLYEAAQVPATYVGHPLAREVAARGTRGAAREQLKLGLAQPVFALLSGSRIAEFETHVPRSYIGWAAAMGSVARAHNVAGAPAQAKAVGERALAHVTDRDREYVLHFLTLELELATADAALGQTDEALARIDARLERYGPTEHGLALGLLHETRARIAWGAGNVDAYERSLREVERRFLPSREPALVARCKRLRELGGGGRGRDLGPKGGDAAATPAASAVQSAQTVVSRKMPRRGDVE